MTAEQLRHGYRSCSRLTAGSGSTSVGARWGGYSGGVPATGHKAHMLSTGEVIL